MSPAMSSVCVEARRDVRIEPACLGVRGDRLFVQAAIAAGVDEPGEQLRIVAVTVGLAQQAHDGCLRLADVRLQVRVELVRDRQPRVEREGAAEGVLGAQLAVGRGVDVLADDAVAATEVRPRGSEPRIELEAPLIQVARTRAARRRCARARWRAGRARRRGRRAACRASATPCRRTAARPERSDDTPRDVVLEAGTDRPWTTGRCAT